MDSSNNTNNNTSNGEQQRSNGSESPALHKSTSSDEGSNDDPDETDSKQPQPQQQIEMTEAHHTWNIFTFIFLLLGGLVGAWVIVFCDPAQPTKPKIISPAPTSFHNDLLQVFEPPTAEECAAISRGDTLPGQRNMKAEFLDVEVDVSVLENVNIVALLPSLETVMRERLVPVLSGCPWFDNDAKHNLRAAPRKLSGPPSSENNHQQTAYAIANSHLELQDRPGISCTTQSPQPCRRISLSLQLFLKSQSSDDYSTHTLLTNTMWNLGQRTGSLLDILDLGARYAGLSIVDVNPGTPIELTWWPTMAPTTKVPIA